MNSQVTITRTDDGAVTKVKSDEGEQSKKYASWDGAISEAREANLISTAEAVGAKVLPPGFPLRSNTDADTSSLSARGFEQGKILPPQ
ncbi:hypothetical protein [Granulicella arctica]|uniref:hypothetical protein n=1 Tax=Granulicella arctica TaxID=940613 RepID=UPI0021E0B89B|nr:hypothetical protein [Granulicella arctica]